MIFSQKKGEKGNAANQQYYWLPNGFKELAAACEGKSQLMIIVRGKPGHHYADSGTSSQSEVVVGSYCHSAFPANISQNWQHEFDYAISHNENNFGFVYSEKNNKMNHYEVRYQKPFGYLYTDHEYGGAINIFTDFAMVSWS